MPNSFPPELLSSDGFLCSARSGKQKTLLLFVIRDHVGSTPMSNLTSTLTQDMEKIWHSLSKVRIDLAHHARLSFEADWQFC